MFSFPRVNSSAFCIINTTLDCYYGALCQSSRFADYDLCSCPSYRDPLSRCQQTIFEVLPEVILIYASLGILIYGTLFLGFLLELIIDLRLRLRNFPMLSKLSLLIFTSLRICHFIFWIAAVNGEMSPSLPIIDTILRSLGVVLLGSLGYLSVCVAWCDLLLKAKKLGQESHRVGVIRIVLICLCAIVSPLSMTINIVISFNPDLTFLSLLSLIGNLIAGTSIIIALSTTTYLLVIVYRWALKMAEYGKSKRVKRVMMKNRWLMAMNCLLLLTIIMIGVFASLPRSLSTVTLLTESITRIVELASTFVLFGFLQSYLLSGPYPLVGYFYGLVGKTELMKITMITSPENQAGEQRETREQGESTNRKTREMKE